MKLLCNIISLLFSLLFLPNSSAQRIVTAKLYSHLAINGGVTIPGFENSNKEIVRFKWVAPSIRFQYDNNRYREWELTDLTIERAPNDETDTRFSIGLRYEYGTRVTKSVQAPLVLSLGGSLRMFGAIEQLNDRNVLGLAVENEFLGLSIAFTPHVTYRIKKHLIFDFCPYAEIINCTIQKEYVYDEFLEEDQRESLDSRFGFFQTILRLGVGWEF